MTLEEAYLEHIILHLKSGDQDNRPMRTYLDSWYAYHVGPPLIGGKSKTPRWMNTGDLEKKPDLADHCHAVSVEARSRIDRGMTGGLVKDHCVPMKTIIAELKKASWSDAARLRAFLLSRYCVAVITQDEHVRVGQGDRVRNSKGIFLTDADGRFARYDCPEYGFRYIVQR